jgi:hypothetical protein
LASNLVGELLGEMPARGGKLVDSVVPDEVVRLVTKEHEEKNDN